jgi:hypothetical protein
MTFSQAERRVCALCGESRGTNLDCPNCMARRDAHRARMRRTRAEDKAEGLCAGGCGDAPDPGFDTCAICRGKARQRGRMRRLRMLPY